MAERVAPVLAPERPRSRPERQRGRGRRWLRRLLGTALVLLAMVAAVVVTGHFLIIDNTATEVRASALVPPGAQARVLIVVAHPGDEFEVAGTVRALASSGARVTALALTRGEARGPAVPGLRGGKLAVVRGQEFARSATDVLGARRAIVATHPDGTLLSGDPAGPVADITRAAAKARATTIVVVPDVGTPDPDGQALVALATRAAQAQGSTVARIWAVTRSPREVSWTNRAFGPVVNPAARVPADVAVRIQDWGRAKAAVLLANGTQSPQLGRDYPLASQIPAAAYFRFLDREYFALAWGQPLS